jgi:hypothetical protein
MSAGATPVMVWLAPKTCTVPARTLALRMPAAARACCTSGARTSLCGMMT